MVILKRLTAFFISLLFIQPFVRMKRWVRSSRYYGRKLTKLQAIFFFVSAAWSGICYLIFQMKEDEVGMYLSLSMLSYSGAVTVWRFMRTWGKSILNICLMLLINSLLVGVLGFALYQLIVSAITLFELHEALKWETTIWKLVFVVILPLTILYVPFFYHQKVKMFDTLRSVKTDIGEGGGQEFGGASSYRDKEPSYVWFSGKRTGDILLGKSTYAYDPYSRFISEKSNNNLITIGTIGSGKSSTVIWPAVVTYCGSMVILDIKGEHEKMTRKRRSEKCKNFNGRVITVAPFGDSRDYYNPLYDIDINDPNCTTLIQAIAEAVVIEQPNSTSDKYWTNMPRQVIAAVIAHVLSTFPKERQTLPEVLDIFYGINDLGEASSEKFQQLLDDMLANPAAGGMVQRAARDLSSMGEKEFGGILSSVSQALNWIGDPLMREHLSNYKSTFSFSDIGLDEYENATVYVQIPFGKLVSQSRWMRVITTMAIAGLRDRDRKPKYETILLLDEFPQLQKFSIISRAYATMRSAGIKIWVFAQSYAQLAAIYSTEANTFVATSTSQFFGVNDLATANLISNSLGNRTDQYGQKNLLLSPSEVMSILSKDANRQIILPGYEGKSRVKRAYLLERLTYVNYTSEFRAYPGHQKYYPNGGKV